MTEPSPRKALRANPFFAYRDPLSGRWLTLMTAAQCQQLATQRAFSPQIRQPKIHRDDIADPDQPDISAS